MRDFKIMGVLNVTPDSFFDGGRYTQVEKAVLRAHEMVSEGAHIIDIGGESTRPFSNPVSTQEELDRVMPVIERLSQDIAIPLSIDTSKPEVMEAAVHAGVSWINDVYALTKPGALTIAAQYPVSVCLVHMQGQPDTMQIEPRYHDVVQDIKHFFQQRIQACLQAGISLERIILDPGFGFGKSNQDNFQVIAKLDQFLIGGCPILLGVSRKSSVGSVLNDLPNQRLQGSVALAVLAFYHGCSIIRTHDVKPTYQALTVVKHVLMAQS